MATGLVKGFEIHKQEEGDWVEASLIMTLGEIIEMDLESLNDFAERNIFDDYSAILSNISYSVAGCDVKNNGIDVFVTADIEYYN